MPVQLNFMERLMMLRLNKGPGPMLDALGVMAFKTASAAVKLGLFEALSGGPLAPAEVARRINASERGTTLLLQALEALGYVQRRGDRYANTPMTAKWMVRGSPNCMADFLTYVEDLRESQWRLDEATRKGEPPETAWEAFARHPGGWEKYQAAMIGAANMGADEILARMRLPPTARRLLDVGGGHGWYSIRFCRQYPGLSATVFDWPQALEVARRTIAAEKMGDRVAVQEGDFWKDGLSGGYDAALLFNVIHMFPPARNQELFRKVAGALNPGGLLVVMDQMAVKASGPAARAMAGLVGLELFTAVNGQTYPPADVAGWLSAAGFTDTRQIFLRTVPGFALAVGRKGS